MVPIALVALVISLILIIRAKEWLLGGFVFITGVLCAAAPFGVWILGNITKFIAWVGSWGIFH